MRSTNRDAGLPPPLMTSEPGSFARFTIVERKPQIIQQVIEDNGYPPDIVQALEAFKDEIASRPMQPLGECAPDVPFWNAELATYQGKTWLDAPWYFAETYFYYLNLTRALMDLYRHKADDCTLLAVSSPAPGATVSDASLHVNWSVVGAPAEGFTLAIDSNPVKELTETAADIPLDSLAQGPHVLTVVAEGAMTRYPLSWTELDDPLDIPILVKVDVPFVVA